MNFTDQLMNILCIEGEKLKPFYEGEQLHSHINSFMVNYWSFSNIDSEMEKTYPPYSKCRRKDKYDNDLVQSFKWTGKLSQLWHILQLF